MERVKKDDTVRVIAGKDRGKEGRVIRVYPGRGKVLVEGVNVATKHRRVQQTRRGSQEGGITHEEMPVPLSNVMPIDPTTGEATRVGSKIVDGKRVRVSRRSDAEF